ncbi:MAG: hypothetical protein WCJ50_08010 [Actinomycetes bacterium]
MSVDVTAQLRRESRETRLEATTTVLIVVALQVALGVLSLRHGWTLWGVGGWVWLVPIVPELVLALNVVAEGRSGDLVQTGERRTFAFALLLIVTTLNALALALLIMELFTGEVRTGGELAIEAVVVWSTLVFTSGMLFWELDGGGPRGRAFEPDGKRDFLFSEMTAPKLVATDWHPRLLDYTYLSFTTAIAWSAADVLPLSRTAKVMMAIETSLSALTILLVAARAVSVIG